MSLYTDGRHTFVNHANGQRTHYIVDDFTDPWKHRETILIQHGFCRTTAHWYHWIPSLAHKYRVIRRDLRGHGLSSYPEPNSHYDYSLETLLDEIVELLDCLGVPKVHFLGESTSGMVAEALAVKHPDRLHSITICSSPTHLPQPALDFFSFGHKDWPTACRVMGSKGWATALSKATGTVTSSDPDYVEWWINQVSVSDGDGLAGYAKFLSTLDAREFLGKISVPMLILAPKHSAVMSVDQMEGVAAKVAGSRLAVIDAPGHEIYTTGAIQCQAATMEFWNSLG